MTLKQQRDKDIEKFEHNFLDGHKINDCGYTLIAVDEDFQAFINQIYINIAKEQIEYIRDIKETLKEYPMLKDNTFGVAEYEGYNQGADRTLEDLISYWQDQLKSLTEN